MRIPSVLGILLALGWTNVHAATVLTDSGAVASHASVACSDEACGIPAGSSELQALSFFTAIVATPFTGDGGVGDANASIATGTWPLDGSAQADATVGSGLAVPTLTAGAHSATNAWIAGNALAVQLYEYTGGGETLALNWSLSGTVANPDSDLATGLTIYLGFFATDDAALPNVNDPAAAFLALASAAYQSPEDNVRTFGATGDVTENGTLEIDVANGDRFYLAMGLTASAAGLDASAVSLSTLTASFAGSPALAADLTTVPLPGAVWLLGAGLAALAGLGARRRRSV